MLDRQAVRRSWFFLGAIALVETIALATLWPAVLPSLGRHAASINPLAWLCAAVVTIAYVAYSVRGLPLVRDHLTTIVPFKWLGLIIAVPSGLLEELFFRQTVMDLAARAHQPVLVQMALSAISFGIIHAVWGIRGGLRAMLPAVASTTVLGALLAGVYVLSGRAVLPCVIAHFAINLVLEPWLIYAYIVRSRSVSARA